MVAQVIDFVDATATGLINLIFISYLIHFLYCSSKILYIFPLFLLFLLFFFLLKKKLN